MMPDSLEEEEESLFHKGRSNEEETNSMTTVDSRQDKYPEGKMTFEKIMEPFGVGVSFKATINSSTEPNLTAKVPEPSNP